MQLSRYLAEREMGKKNKRAKLELALHQLRDERDREKSGETNENEQVPCRSPDLRFEGRQPAQDRETRDGALIIPLDPDIHVEDLPTSVLPRPRGYRTKHTDEARVIEYLQNRELEAPDTRLDEIDADGVLHARSHECVNRAVDTLKDMASTVDCLLIGLDLEGKENNMPVTLQLSATTDETFTVLFQLQSHRDLAAPAHIFVEGMPSRLREIFEINNANFCGKNIAWDVCEAADLA